MKYNNIPRSKQIIFLCELQTENTNHTVADVITRNFDRIYNLASCSFNFQYCDNLIICLQAPIYVTPFLN